MHNPHQRRAFAAGIGSPTDPVGVGEGLRRHPMKSIRFRRQSTISTMRGAPNFAAAVGDAAVLPAPSMTAVVGSRTSDYSTRYFPLLAKNR
jgi:hypothetical protein